MGGTVDVKKTAPKSFIVPPFNGVRKGKRQKGNGKRRSAVLRSPPRVPLPLSLIGLWSGTDVEKHVLTRSEPWGKAYGTTLGKKNSRVWL